MRGRTRCALLLTVAVFLTKNLNLTLSKFWPPAPAEMRNSPLPTNGSFRQEIYVKKTLQHSPGEDVYSLCLHRIPNQDWENIVCTFRNQTMLGRFCCEMRTQLRAWLCHWSPLRSCQLMLGSGLLQNNEDRVIGQWESSALRSELVLIFTTRPFHYSKEPDRLPRGSISHQCPAFYVSVHAIRQVAAILQPAIKPKLSPLWVWKFHRML